MFTGIVEETGTVVGVTTLPDEARRLSIRADAVLTDARPGDSISVSGVCLTVAELTDGVFSADVMKQTLDLTTLGELEVGAVVNLERAARVDSRLGGHIVQGHVDGTGTLLSRTSSEHWDVLRFAAPSALARYIVDKGSIAIDGVSLTVSAVDPSGAWFEVSLIPTTLALTTLGDREVGHVVNLEVDVIAKYVEGLMRHGGSHD